MISRRQLLHIAASLTPAALLYGPSAASWGQEKVSKQAVQYQDQPKDGEKCKACKFFNKPDGCQLVKGEVSPEGWCSLFQANA